MTLLIVVALACSPGEDDDDTITAATPPPATTPTDTDLALTQTTEVGEERSPNEGGVLTDPAYQGEVTDTTATETGRTSTAEPPRP